MGRGGYTRGTRAADLTQEMIQREYFDKGTTMREACKVLNCSPKILIQAMRNYGLAAPSNTRNWHRKTYPPKRQRPVRLPKHMQIPLEAIQREYLESDVGMREACVALACSPTVLIAALKYHGIVAKSKTRKVAVVGGHSGKWSGRDKIINRGGYVTISMPNHPQANKAGLVLEHRIVAERMLGRPLAKEEVVHHINHVRTDNRPENLMIFPNHAAHRRFHHKGDQAFIDKLFDIIAKQKALLTRYREMYGELA